MKSAIVVLVVLAACYDGTPSGTATADLPVIDAASVAANPQNVLSAVVQVEARRTDSIAVWYHLAGAAPGHDSVTPAVPGAPGAIVPVLGLLPGSRYVLRVAAVGAGVTVLGDSLLLQTDTLPADLPRFTASGTEPEPGYLVFGAGRYGLVIDNTGRVVWYRKFANGPGLAFMAQRTGRYTTRPPTADPGDLEPWVEIDPLGNFTRTMGCAGGLQPRLHDLIDLPDGSWWLMCDDTRTMDLSSLGGKPNAVVMGTVIQHLSAAGDLLFSWSPFDHFQITDLDSADRTGPSVNWTHGNALDFTPDGDLLVSFRSLNEVTKISVTTGEVIWRLGGRRSDFTFEGTPLPAFTHQHGMRRCPSGALLLLDNIGDPSASRAERYVLDEAARTASLDRSFSSLPGVVTQIGGSVQNLADGHTLVSFGTAGRVEEYDATGQVVWHIEGNAGYVFRAQRIRSLYQPSVGSSR